MLNSSIWPIDETKSDATTLSQRIMVMKVYSALTKAPALLEPHHQAVLCNFDLYTYMLNQKITFFIMQW